MLTKQNCGKYLDSEFEDKRGRAIVDRTLFSSEELAFLEISGADGGGRDNDDSYKIGITRAGRHTQDNAFDIRKLPKTGGK